MRKLLQNLAMLFVSLLFTLALLEGAARIFKLGTGLFWQPDSQLGWVNIPDASGTNRDVICTDDQVVVRWEGTGTPKGSTEKVSVTGITIMKVVKGKVVEEWEEMNSLSLMMQMGYELKPPAMTDGGKE